MKKFTFLALSAAFICCGVTPSVASSTAGIESYKSATLSRLSTPYSQLQGFRKTDRQIRAINDRFAARRVSPAPTPWCPQVQTVYEFDGLSWQMTETFHTQFDDKGQISQDVIENAFDGTSSRTTYTYNENGKVATILQETSTDGVNFTNTSRREVEYDPILTWVITKSREWIWRSGEWALVGNNYNRDITRNADGNITLVEVAVLFQGVYDPTQRFSIEYDADGKAVGMQTAVLVNSEEGLIWKTDKVFTDVVWESFNGQVADITEIYHDGNRIQSCHYVDNSYSDDADMTVTYDDDTDTYIAVSTGTIGGSPDSKMTMTKTLYPNDGYREHLVTEDSVLMEMGLGSMLVIATQKYYPQWDLDEEASMYMDFAGETGYSNYLKGEMTYNDETGLPESYLASDYYYQEEVYPPTPTRSGETDFTNPEPPASDEFTPMIRIEFSDYVSAGLDHLQAEVTDANAEYYTIEGIRTAAPVSGQIAICRQGDKVSKFIAK